MKYVYILYQYLIGFPLLIVLSIITCLITILFFPFKYARWLHQVQAFWARCCCWVMFIPVTVDGLENIDPKQSYVFVANHQSSYDIPVIYGWLPVVFKWLMKIELKRVPIIGWGCMAAGHIFVDRKNFRHGAASLQQAEEVLRNGVSTVIFPEGTRSADGNTLPFKRGAFMVAEHLNMPIVPVSLSGLHELMEDDAVYLKWHPLHMHIGKPVYMSDYADEKEAIAAIREAVIAGKKSWN